MARRGVGAGDAVRRAGTDDQDALLQLIRDFNREDDHDHDEERVRRALGPLLEDDQLGQVWIVDVAGRPRGYCVLAWGYSLESGGRECVVDEIFVSPSSRGVGGLLLDAALAGAREAGVLVVFLETEVRNARARAFYQRHGFLLEDSIWMRRVL
ncbi:MAG: GNAT family N-acetyltransferase [Acidimicrobiales bacterium]